MAINEQPLEKALREAADWKARAQAAQAAAETMRQKAQTLKDGAHQALQGTRDLQDSLQRARAEILALQNQQKDQSRRTGELEEALAQSQRERTAAQNTLSTVQQQLSLYVAALEESRRGSDLEGIRAALRSALASPTVEEALRQELGQAREEIHGLQVAFERSQGEVANLEAELRAREGMLEDKEREYFSLYGELDLTRSMLAQLRLGQESSERQQRQHQRTLDLLRAREAALSVLESEMREVLEENRRLIESHPEVETLRETILMLEDQISDLEIVNSDLYQRLAQRESDGEPGQI